MTKSENIKTFLSDTNDIAYQISETFPYSEVETKTISELESTFGKINDIISQIVKYDTTHNRRYGPVHNTAKLPMQKSTTQTLDNLGYENITENPAPAIPVHETCPPTVSATKRIGILYSYTIYISEYIGAPTEDFDGTIHVIDEHGLTFTYAFNPNNKSTLEHALQQIDEDFCSDLEPQEIITLYRFKVTQKNWYR